MAPSDDNKGPATAFVLAAGLGTRMRPLTDRMPKPMLRLAGRPLIDYVLDRLRDAGLHRAVVNLHYFADILQQHLAGRKDLEILLSDERAELLDTGGGIAKALSLIGDQPFIVHNSDSVWIEQSELGAGGPARQADGSSNIKRLIAAWDESLMDCLLMLAPSGGSLGYDGAGDFELLSDGQLRRRASDGTAPYVFAGVSIMQPRLFAEAPTGPFSLNLLWDKAIKGGRLYGMAAKGIWMHVGDPASLKLAEQQLAAGHSQA